MSTRYRNLKRLRRDHPARNARLYSIRAEYRTQHFWNSIGVVLQWTLNDLQKDKPDWFKLEWRAPVPAKEAK